MTNLSATLPTGSGMSGATPPRTLAAELGSLAAVYILTIVFGSMTIAACGPGCCFVFYSVIAGVSGLLMLRRHFVSRCICLGVLLLSLYGMWHEKEARDTWGQHALRVQIQNLQQKLVDSQSK